MPQKTKHTPMMEQYIQIKKEYSDAFLFYRLGDFYELFFDDAVKVAHLLELTLTSRNKNADEQIPMCGVPHHSAQNYINQLIEMGYKVAICEQMEDPKQIKGNQMVKREVVQVVTPGTIMQGSAVDAKENNYLAAIYTDGADFALSYADLTTGELKTTLLGELENVFNELMSLEIKEVVLSASEGESALEQHLSKTSQITLSFVKDIDLTEDYGLLKKISNKLLKQATELLLHYLQETQMRSLDHLQEAQVYETTHYLRFGQEARKNLELTKSLNDNSKYGTLLWLLDETKTAMGGRTLKAWLDKPLIQQEQIIKRQDLTENLMNHFFEQSDLGEALTQVYDLERLSGRIAYGSVNARDLVQLKESLLQIPLIRAIIESMNEEGVWDDVLKKLDPIEEVSTLIDQAINEEPPISVTEGEIIKKGFHEGLDEYLDAMKNGKQWIANLEASERDKTGIKNLKVGFNKVFGYYIEITKANLNKIDVEALNYNRKQTLTNAERFITPELKEKESIILGAEEKSKALEYELFIQVRQEVKRHIERIQELAKVISRVDVLRSFAKISTSYNFIRPTYHTDNQDVHIIDGRHPMVEKVKGSQSYVPNDVDLRGDREVLLITGPNMSGKSTYMRQLALTVILGQMGCFVPAKEADLPIFDAIFTRIGASDDLIGGQSTFMVEMNETNHALMNATKKSLLLFDEIGRGTATYDGMALAEAIIEYVHDNIKAKTLFSTHYHELTQLSNRLNGLVNIHVGAQENKGNLVFMHKILEGPADKSYGVQVAKLAGLPEELLKRAAEILKGLEENHNAPIPEEKSQEWEIQQKDTSTNNTDIEVCEDGQLSLFPLKATEPLNAKQRKILETVDQVDMMHTTPMEAFNVLSQLKDYLRE